MDRWAWSRGPTALAGPLTAEALGPGLVLLLGPNGCGKSTLLRALAGSLEDYERGEASGRLLRDEKPPQPRDVALLPQDSADAVTGNTILAEFTLRLAASGVAAAHVESDARGHLLALGLHRRADEDASQLSEGERRRLMLEATLAAEPSLVLLDEPLDHVDTRWRRVLLNRITDAAAGALVIVATHRPDLYAGVESGRIVMPGSVPAQLHATPPNGAVTGTPSITATDVRVPVGRDAHLEIGGLDLGPGLHVLMGDNGSGKTTLLRALFGFQRLDSGFLRVGGVDVTQGPARVAREGILLFENPSRMFFRPTVAEEVSFGLNGSGSVGESIAFTGLSGHVAQSPFRLSGGQRERLALAVVASRSRPVVLLDEPTHGLDDDGFARLVMLLDAWRRDRCLVVATHDQRLVEKADSRLVIRGPSLEVVR